MGLAWISHSGPWPPSKILAQLFQSSPLLTVNKVAKDMSRSPRRLESKDIAQLIFAREQARLAKDWGQADNLRAQLQDGGVQLYDKTRLARMGNDYDLSDMIRDVAGLSWGYGLPSHPPSNEEIMINCIFV
eukprot:Skav218593  [mRNA]  locus=scaffold3628:21761:33429:+ [translate_table: standard]